MRRWRCGQQAKRVYSGLFLVACVVGMVTIAYEAVTTDAAISHPAGGRELLSSGGVEIVPGLNGECGWETDNGGKAFAFSVLYILLNIYLFLGIAIICDGHFTASLEMICSEKGLNLNTDVAGATFMAAGSSAPELATSFVGTFLAESNVGVGTIIGSAVFNILVIIGATAVLSKDDLDLDWRPVVRDNFFYLISVILLILVIKVPDTDEIKTIDSVILLIWYTCYIVYMGFNETIIMKFCPPEDDDEEEEENPQGVDSIDGVSMGTDPDKDRSETPSDVTVDVEASSSQTVLPKGAGGGAEEVQMDEGSTLNAPEKKEPKRKKSAPIMHSNLYREGADEQERKLDEEDDLSTEHESDEEEEEESAFCQALDKVNEVLSLPWELLFEYTMPDCAYPFELIDNIQDKIDDKHYYEEHGKEAQAKRKAAKQKQLDKLLARPLTCGQRWFWATFFISLVHITWMSYFMVELMTKCGCIFHISDTVMGLTFLAMGTSIPDALGSLAVAQKGEGDMAVSNAVGSNVFDICMGLGLPWFIKCVAGSGPIPIDDTDTIVPSVLILVAIIVLLFSTFAISNWKLAPKVGYILLSAYVAFVIYSLVYEAVK